MVNAVPSFSLPDGGSAITPIGSGNDVGRSVILQEGGKILVGGYAASEGGGDGNLDYALARFNSDGSLDESFGGGSGRILTPVGSAQDQGHVVVPTANGGFVLAGFSQVVVEETATPPTMAYVYSAARYLADGTLDTSFGTGGTLVTEVFDIDGSHAAALQADGKLLLGGDGFVNRYNVDGSFDIAFTVPPELAVHDLTVVGSAIVAAGTTEGRPFALILTTAGTVDGGVFIETGADSGARAVAVQEDGKVLVAGFVEREDGVRLLVTRIAEGQLDPTFGEGNGIVEIDYGPEDSPVGQRILIQEDGKILVVGNGVSGSFVQRLNADGSNDASFGVGGMIRDANNVFNDAVLQPDGTIVVVGTATMWGQTDVLVQRYLADGRIDASFGATDTLGGVLLLNERGQPVVLDTNVAIYDADVGASGNYAGATFTLNRDGEPHAGDVFSSSGTLGFGEAETPVVVDGTVIGTVTLNGNGSLAIIFNEAATEALVNSALRQITYTNTSTTPGELVRIVWSFSDGSGTATGTTTVVFTSIQGSSEDDVLMGGEDADTLKGLEGNDSLRGEGGNDIIDGNEGADTLHGGAGVDLMTGGAGDDLYIVQQGADMVVERAGGGIDTMWSYLGAGALSAYVENGRIGSTGAADLSGNNLANVLYAGRGDNVLDGLTGSDTVSYATGALSGVQVSLASDVGQTTGGSGRDTLLSIENLVGSNFGDQLTGKSGVNRIDGGAGDDTIDGGTGADVMLGGTGNDTFTVRDAGDVVTELAGGGTDLVNSYLANYVLGSGIENGRIRSADGAQLTGNGIANVLSAGTGNDTLNGGAASDTVAYTSGTTTGVQVNLATQLVTGGSGSDTLVSIENVTGSAYGDLLQGSAGSNTLIGANGADTLIGGGGADVLVGGIGNDSLTGGTGADIFRIETTLSSSYNTDSITDFASGTDTIVLDSDEFFKLETGSLAAGSFRVNATGAALDADDRIVYNSTTGALSFDADGSGSGAAVRFAILASAPTLAAGDFLVS